MCICTIIIIVVYVIIIQCVLFAHNVIYAYSSCAITCVDIVKLLTEVYLVCINVSPNVIHLTYHPVVFMLETAVAA